jgi:hypothetical protein
MIREGQVSGRRPGSRTQINARAPLRRQFCGEFPALSVQRHRRDGRLAEKGEGGRPRLRFEAASGRSGAERNFPGRPSFRTWMGGVARTVRWPGGARAWRSWSFWPGCWTRPWPPRFRADWGAPPALTSVTCASSAFCLGGIGETHPPRPHLGILRSSSAPTSSPRRFYPTCRYYGTSASYAARGVVNPSAETAFERRQPVLVASYATRGPVLATRQRAHEPLWRRGSFLGNAR